MNFNTDDWDANDWENYYNSAIGNEPEVEESYRVRIRFFDGYLGEEGMSVLLASGLGDSEDEESKYFFFLDGMSYETALKFYSEKNSLEDWYIVPPTGGFFDDNNT